MLVSNWVALVHTRVAEGLLPLKFLISRGLKRHSREMGTFWTD